LPRDRHSLNLKSLYEQCLQIKNIEGRYRLATGGGNHPGIRELPSKKHV